jgi:hypothetical protein
MCLLTFILFIQLCYCNEFLCLIKYSNQRINESTYDASIYCYEIYCYEINNRIDQRYFMRNKHGLDGIF